MAYYSPREPSQLPTVRSVHHLVTSLAVALLIAGLGGAVAPYPAVAASVGAVAAIAATRLVRLALVQHARQRSFGSCRGAGFLGLAMLATGLTVAVMSLVPAALRSVVTLGGLAVVVAAYLLGMLLLPGAAPTLGIRLRRGFDGLSLGISLAFAGWVLTPGETPAVALAAVLLAAGGLPVLAITALRALDHHRAALLCGAGAVAAVLSLTVLVVLLAYGAPAWTLPLVAVPLVVGPALTAAGARRAGAAAGSGESGAAAGLGESGASAGLGEPGAAAGSGEPGTAARPGDSRAAAGLGESGAAAGLGESGAGARLAGAAASSVAPVAPVDSETHLSTYRLLTIPAIVAGPAAFYHLVAFGQFDRVSVVLGLAVIPTVVVREILAVLDIRRYARRLVAQEAHSRSLVAGAHDLTLVVGEDLRVRWQSPTAARLFGLSDAEVLGRGFAELMHPDDADEVSRVLTEVLAGEAAPTGRPPLVMARLRDGHGTWRDTESTVSDQRRVPEVAALVVHVRDVGERRRLERTLHQLAFTDQLTGLANRRQLMRTIVTQRAVPGHTGALLVVDLHGIADVNDVRGRLYHAAGVDDVVARLTGDEFALVTVDGPVLAYALGTRLLTALTEPYRLPGVVVALQVSIGLAELSGGDTVDDVLRRADLARRRAQQLGANRIEWYDTYLEEQLVRRLELERELPGAAGRGELDLVFQPVLGLLDQQPVGTEALLRWRSPVLGTVLPGELLPVAEDLGLIEEVDQWVLHAACRQLASWSRHGRRLWMAVNVSPGELVGPGFVDRVAMTLAAAHLAPDRLVVEIAEPRVPIDLPAVAAQLAALRALGVRTALDDFGAGQASLAQLRRLPVDLLKVDRSLVSDPGGRRGKGKSLIDVVVSLGRRLGLEIVAEGLESQAQIAQARAAGCRFGQGYALSQPATAERVEAYLEEFPAQSA
jgi:PAS domain S-box-containing protein/diguanylate cyclase (GGDEF)-like protein